MPVCYGASVAVIAGTLLEWGAVEVRGHGGEVFLLTLGGLVWIVLSVRCFPWLGLGIADDIAERRNPAALSSLPAAVFAIALIYVGGSLGEGPSYAENVFSAALGTVGFFLLWFALELVGRVSVSIAEERDVATGMRLGGFFLALGTIIARAVAGDWHSASATVHDFIRDGWPTVVICVLAIFLERTLRPSRARPFPNWRISGVPPALMYLGCAIAWVLHLGRWEGMPK